MSWYTAKHAPYAGRYPVFVSHTKEIEQLLYFVTDLQNRLKDKGQYSGPKYDCLTRVRRKCTDLLLKLYTEETNIMLMDDLDHRWTILIVRFVQNVLLKDQRKAG